MGESVMRWKSVFLAGVVTLCLLGGTAGANEALKTWKGKTIGIKLNRETVPEGGLLVDGRAYVPVKLIEEDFRSLVDVNNQGDVEIVNPNVHLFLFSGSRQAMRSFGHVFTGKNDFFVFAQIEKLMKRISAIRTTVLDPTGNVLETQTMRITESGKEDFWYTTNAMRIDFKQPGTYIVRLSVQLIQEERTEWNANNEPEFRVLAERKITALKKDS